MPIQHNLPISFGTNELTPINAYFLGAILSANEPKNHNGKIVWLAPYRHNPVSDPAEKVVLENSIKEHSNFIKTLIKRSNGKVLSKEELKKKGWFPANKQGFGVIFESPIGTTVTALADRTTELLSSADREIKRCFLVGAFDGRASIDYDSTRGVVRYLSLDCSDDTVAELLNDTLQFFGIETNYNTARDRVEGGRPRRPQFRISSQSVETFVREIGMLCPSRFNQAKRIYSALHENQEYNVLYGLKTLADTENIFTVSDVVEEDITEYQADKELIDEINEEIATTLEQEEDFEYAGVPQTKDEPTYTNGRKVYKRDKKRAINALKKAKHKCEVDSEHSTFIRKNSSQPYTEPHHLIPLGFSDRFDVSLDVEENIVSLCSNCHNQLHYGRDIRNILEYLYNQRKELLEKVGIMITLQDLFEMYNA